MTGPGTRLRLTGWKVDRLVAAWSDPTVTTKALCRELDLGQSALQKHAKRLGLGYRPRLYPYPEKAA